jgi:alanyl-tRNA synthetase
MTIKLFWEKPYEKKFHAEIIDIDKNGIILDKTLFYPESGNQASDKGIIRKNGDIFNIDEVSLEGTQIIHHISTDFKSKLEIGDKVEGQIDWNHRYRLMKAHSSQHIISAILNNKFNVKTNKVKIRPNRVVMWLVDEIDFPTLQRVLKNVNKIFTLQKDKIKSKILPVKKAKEYKEHLRGGMPGKKQIRLVFTEDYDVTCCGGTHVQSTDEIGPIYIYEFKKGKKIKYYLGNKAMEHMSKYNTEFLQLGDLFRIPINQVTWRIKKRAKDMEELLKEKEILSARILELIARNPDLEKDGLKISLIPFSMEKDILNKAFDNFPENSVLIFRLKNQVVKIVTNSEKFNAAELLSKLFDKYGGQGGGNPRLAQGRMEELPNNFIDEIQKLI